MANPQREPLTPGGWVRLVIYIVTVLTGLVAVVSGELGYETVQSAAESLGQILLILSGGTAATHLGTAPDQRRHAAKYHQTQAEDHAETALQRSEDILAAHQAAATHHAEIAARHARDEKE